MGKAYCRNEVSEYFFILDENDTLFKIVSEFYDLVLDKGEDEIFELIKENPVANYFFKRESAGIISDKDGFCKIEEKDYLPFSNDIIICDEKINASEIREKFGVLALNIEDDFLLTQNFNFGYTLEPNKECKFKCWSDIVEPKSFVPINSAILVDNYIWKNTTNFHDENSENLYKIISKIIPSTLEVPFQLLINIDNRKCGIDKNMAQEKVKKIKKNLEKITGKKVEVGISSHTNQKLFHSRVILTNHHLFSSDRGFTIIKNGKVTSKTHGSRNWVFQGIDNFYGQIDKHLHNNQIRDLKISTEFNKKQNSNTIYNAGEWDNRLLN